MERNRVTAAVDAPAEQISLVLYEVVDDVAWIHLNRPHRLNAVVPELIRELCLALERAIDEDVRAAVLGGSGRAFCSGYDLKSNRRPRPEFQHRRDIDRTHDVTRLIRRAPFAVIAAVKGYALGNGCEFALAADAIVAADDAQFGFPEVGWGLSVTGGVTALLTAAVGPHRAKRLILGGDWFSAQEAHDWGLAQQVAPATQVGKVAGELAHRWAARPPAAFARAKRSIDQAFAAELETAYALETEHSVAAAMGREDEHKFQGFGGVR